MMSGLPATAKRVKTEDIMEKLIEDLEESPKILAKQISEGTVGSDVVEMSEASNKAPNRNSKQRRREYGGPLRRVRCQADGLAYAFTVGWMRVETQQRDAHPTEDHHGGSMNPRDFTRAESQ